jgi:hypothetical protein
VRHCYSEKIGLWRARTMKIKVDTFKMQILPENAQDEIYIKLLLELRDIGDSCKCTLEMNNQNAMRYIEIRPAED